MKIINDPVYIKPSNRKTIIVVDCNDCPFKTLGGWEGETSHCALNKKYHILPQKQYFSEITKTPKWCLLDKSEIIVKK
jgi:hypothetical protein